MSCFTITFHAVKRSMRMSDGRKSFGAMFFRMRDCWRETAEPALLLPLEMEVALERDWPSFIMAKAKVVVWEKREAGEAGGGGCMRALMTCAWDASATAKTDQNKRRPTLKRAPEQAPVPTSSPGSRNGSREPHIRQVSDKTYPEPQYSWIECKRRPLESMNEQGAIQHVQYCVVSLVGD